MVARRGRTAKNHGGVSRPSCASGRTGTRVLRASGLRRRPGPRAAGPRCLARRLRGPCGPAGGYTLSPVTRADGGRPCAEAGVTGVGDGPGPGRGARPGRRGPAYTKAGPMARDLADDGRPRTETGRSAWRCRRLPSGADAPDRTDGPPVGLGVRASTALGRSPGPLGRGTRDRATAQPRVAPTRTGAPALGAPAPARLARSRLLPLPGPYA